MYAKTHTDCNRMTNKDSALIEFMSSEEFAPIDRVNFLKQRVEEAKEETRAECKKEKWHFGIEKRAEGFNTGLVEGNKKGYTRAHTEILAEIRRYFWNNDDIRNDLLIKLKQSLRGGR